MPPPQPPAEPFRWSRPAAATTQAGSYATPPVSYDGPGAAAAPPPAAPLHRRPFRPLSDWWGLANLLMLLLVLTLLIAAAANVFLGITVKEGLPEDTFLKIDENQWIAWAAAGVFAAAAYVLIVVWLCRAYGNQLALGTPETRLPVSVVAVLCFVPVVNLVVMTMALREIWQSADLQRNEWAARSRRAKIPNVINVVWLGPVLSVVAWVVFGLVVDSRIGADGPTSVSDARFLYFSRVLLLFELFWITLAIRRVFGSVTEQQERAQWHLQLGQGFGGPSPAPSQGGAPFPTVPS